MEAWTGRARSWHRRLETEQRTMAGSPKTPTYRDGLKDASSRSFGSLPQKSGFLEKLSGGGLAHSAKWQRRYFALSDGVLAWAKTATKISKCGDACLPLCASFCRRTDGV